MFLARFRLVAVTAPAALADLVALRRQQRLPAIPALHVVRPGIDRRLFYCPDHHALANKSQQCWWALHRLGLVDTSQLMLPLVVCDRPGEMSWDAQAFILGIDLSSLKEDLVAAILRSAAVFVPLPSSTMWDQQVANAVSCGAILVVDHLISDNELLAHAAVIAPKHLLEAAVAVRSDLKYVIAARQLSQRLAGDFDWQSQTLESRWQEICGSDAGCKRPIERPAAPINNPPLIVDSNQQPVIF